MFSATCNILHKCLTKNCIAVNDIQIERIVAVISVKLFEIPKIIHIFARFSAEACFFNRKSLKQGTINKV